MAALSKQRKIARICQMAISAHIFAHRALWITNFSSSTVSVTILAFAVKAYRSSFPKLNNSCVGPHLSGQGLWIKVYRAPQSLTRASAMAHLPD